MAISKYTLYKYLKVAGTWRYCKAAYHDNGKIKPDIVFVSAKEGLVEKHPEGRYYMSHNGTWIDVGTDALDAQRKRKQRLSLDEFNRLSGNASYSLAEFWRRTTLCKHAFISPKSLTRRLFTVQNPLLVGLPIGLQKVKVLCPSLDKHSEKWSDSLPKG